MPLRRPAPRGLILPQSRSPARPVSLDQEEFPVSYHGDNVALNRSGYSSGMPSLSAQLSPGRRGLIGYGSLIPMYGDPFREARETDRLMFTYISSQSMHPDPSFRDCNVAIDMPEADDWLHAPDDKDDNGTICTWKGLANLGCVGLLGLIILGAIIGGLIYYILAHPNESNDPAYYRGTINATSQLMEISYALPRMSINAENVAKL